MNNLKIIAITLLSFMLLSCIPAAPPVDISAIYQASSAPQSSSTRRSSSTSRTRRSGGCQTRACEDICEDIYEDGDEGDGVIDRCLKLSERTLYTFETIIDYLAEPTLGNVRTVKEEYLNEFEDLLDVSQYPWVDIAEHVNRSEAEALLVFIASSESVTEVLNNAARNYEGYDKYEGVKELLDQVAGGSGGQCKYKRAFCEVGISGNQTFYSIAYSEKNVAALFMLQNLLEESCGIFYSVKIKNARDAAAAAKRAADAADAAAADYAKIAADADAAADAAAAAAVDAADVDADAAKIAADTAKTAADYAKIAAADAADAAVDAARDARVANRRAAATICD